MAKKLKLKIPKRVAGVKIPKSVRKGALASFLNSGAGQVLLAEALVVLGSSIAAKSPHDYGAAGRAMRHPLEALKEAGPRRFCESRRRARTEAVQPPATR